MELKTFIRDAIVSIVEGVREAQESVVNSQPEHPSSAMVVPFQHEHGKGGQHLTDSIYHRLIQMVEFDVAVTAQSGTEGGVRGGIKIFGGVLQLGGEKKESSGQTAVSRLRFSVPVVLPSQVDEKEMRERLKAQV